MNFERNIGIGLLIMIGMLAAMGFGISKLGRAYDLGYEDGYEKGYNKGFDSGHYNCKAEYYGWMPQDACNEDDRCRWLSENQEYGDFYDCLNWFLQNAYERGSKIN